MFSRYLFRSSTGSLAIAHNGNLVNANHLKQHLERSGSIFNSTSDTEVVIHLIKKVKPFTIPCKSEKCIVIIKRCFLINDFNERYDGCGT